MKGLNRLKARWISASSADWLSEASGAGFLACGVGFSGVLFGVSFMAGWMFGFLGVVFFVSQWADHYFTVLFFHLQSSLHVATFIAIHNL